MSIVITPPGELGTFGEQLDDISARMDATTAAWAAAGHPLDGDLADAREAVFADLRAFNSRVAAAHTTPQRLGGAR